MIAAVHIIPSPHDNLSAGPYCGVKRPANWRVRCAGSCPTIHVRIISAASVKIIRTISAPDHHFTASPCCCVSQSSFGCIDGAGRCPTVAPRIISPARVQEAGVATAPDNHFCACPDCRVKSSSRRRVGDGGRHPCIGARVVSSTGIQKTEGRGFSAPDDHFTPSPDGCVVCSSVGHAVGACSSPSVKASAFLLQWYWYRRKSITGEWSLFFARTSPVTDGPADTTAIQGRRKQALREYWPRQALGDN